MDRGGDDSADRRRRGRARIESSGRRGRGTGRLSTDSGEDHHAGFVPAAHDEPVASTLVFEPVDRDPHRIEPVDGEREAEECGANGVPARHPVDKPRPARRQRHGPWRAPGEHTILPGAVEHVRATAVERAAKEGPTRAEREREVTNVCPVGATRERKPAANERALLAWRRRHGGRRARDRLWRCVGGRSVDRTSASSERRKLECAPKEPRRMKR